MIPSSSRFPDPFGRLVGKRFRADYFLDSVASQGTHGCSYLLTVNLDMDPLDGFKVANWDAGFGDFAFRPDLATLRALPWQPGAALVICDLAKHDGSLVAEAPRSVLKRQLDLLAAKGLSCYCASELEFYLFNQTYHSAFTGGYRDLQPASDYRIDYHLMQPTRDEPLMRAIRNGMTAARVPIESSKGEWGRGQHEINFTYAEPLAMADMHVLFKQGVKEITEQHGKAVTFMAKYSPTEAGSSCHVHISLWKGGRNIFWDAKSREGSKTRSPVPRRADGILPRAMPVRRAHHQQLQALSTRQLGAYPHGLGHRQPHRRLPRRRPRQRLSHRKPHAGRGCQSLSRFRRHDRRGPGGCGGETGLRQRNTGATPMLIRSWLACPASLRDAVDLFDRSKFARSAFGDPVVDFYVHHARIEQQAFSDAVTDWEKVRYFERI